MCGRMSITQPLEAMARLFDATPVNDLPVVPNYNVCPTVNIHTVVSAQGTRHLKAMRWGFVPHWYQTLTDGPLLINARSETVQGKPTFREAFNYRRCLVVASGWYEWSAPKTPWHIQLYDGGVMAFGGLLYGQADQQRFVILTTAADAGLADIHHRAPLTLAPEDYDVWMAGDAETASRLLRPAPAHWFNWYRVGPDVGKVGNDHPALVTPLSDDALRMETAPQGDLFA